MTSEVSRLAQDARSPPIAPRSTATSTTSARSSAASSASRRATRSGEPRELPGAPAGVPDSFAEHVKLMFDLQALAFAGRHHARLLVQDSAATARRASIRRAASTLPFHPASHHGEHEERVKQFAQINKYHVSLLPYFLEKLKSIQEGDGNLLDKTLIIYGSPMGDSNVHNHKRCPLFLVGHANGKLKGNLHLKAADGTPMANAMLTLLHGLGLDDMKAFGDSTGELDLNVAPDQDRELERH